ncbi:MAG: hypothetical protein HC876_16405 [Chloroflexaceae bacterium]|nr:hypothetical protein [Chloroflexaceae bacterium]
MTTQGTNRKIQWLPILLIAWNLLDIAVHEGEPLRITGNIVGIAAALIVLFGVVRAYAPYILGLAAVIVVGLNVAESFLHGYLPPMLIFVGVSVFSSSRARLFQHRLQFLGGFVDGRYPNNGHGLASASRQRGYCVISFIKQQHGVL